MTVHAQNWTPYIGGQLEVQNRGEGCVERGEIASISIDGPDFVVTFVWLARMEISSTTGWVVSSRSKYEVDTALCGISRNIGPGEGGGGNRLYLEVPVCGDVMTFFPPDGSKLDPKDVVGLFRREAAPATT